MWELVWHDEFDGPAGNLPDSSKWTYDLGGYGWGNKELQYYTGEAENAALDGKGSLVITVRQIPRLAVTRLNCWYGPCRYTSARLLTRGLFEFTYGRVETRLKIPYGQGIWSAYWMTGADALNNPWPKCGEIDIVENIGREPDIIHGTLHGPGYRISHAHTLEFGKAFADEFHAFALEWEPNALRWYVDDEQFFVMTPDQLPLNKDWVFNHRFFILLNVAVGGIWPGYPNEQTVFPQQMLIDYVRVYQERTHSAIALTAGDIKNVQSTDEYIPPSYNYPQVRGKFFQRMVSKHSVCAEIGVHRGNNIRTILDITEPAELHLIDPWYLFGKEWEWGQGNRSTIDALVGILKTFEGELVKKTIILHIGFDQDVLPTFPDQYFDWVYLDTSHQYEQTLRELDLLKRKVKADGVITGDDWHTDPEHIHYGLCRAIREFVEREPYEIVYTSDEDKQWAIRRRE